MALSSYSIEDEDDLNHASCVFLNYFFTMFFDNVLS